MGHQISIAGKKLGLHIVHHLTAVTPPSVWREELMGEYLNPESWTCVDYSEQQGSTFQDGVNWPEDINVRTFLMASGGLPGKVFVVSDLHDEKVLAVRAWRSDQDNDEGHPEIMERFIELVNPSPWIDPENAVEGFGSW